MLRTLLHIMRVRMTGENPLTSKKYKLLGSLPWNRNHQYKEPRCCLLCFLGIACSTRLFIAPEIYLEQLQTSSLIFCYI